MKAIVNGTVYTPLRTIDDGIVVIDGAVIQAVGPRAYMPIPRDAQVMDAQRQAIVPGLIDVHTFGNGGLMMTSPVRVAEELPAFARNVARFGVTGFLISPNIGDRAFIAEILAALAHAIPRTHDGAQPLGIHLEGPWLDPEQHGAWPLEMLHAPTLDEAREYIEAARGYLRIVTMASNLPNAMETARFLRSNGVLPSLGHSNMTYDAAREALACGAFASVTHVYNAMSGLNHRKPGFLGAVLSSDDIFGCLICDGIHVHPAAVKIALRALGADRIILVTDAMPGAGAVGDTFVMLGRTVRVIDGVARLPDGTIAGSTLTMNRAVKNAQTFGSLSLNDALKLATLNPARLLGLNKGRLEAGADADVVVMDDAGNVALTIVAGDLTYRQ